MQGLSYQDRLCTGMEPAEVACRLRRLLAGRVPMRYPAAGPDRDGPSEHLKRLLAVTEGYPSRDC